MKKKTQLSISRLIEGLEGLDDPRRQSGNLRLKLVDILVIILLALICGCDSWEDIEDYGNTKEEWLGSFLELPNGIPCADTYRRLLEHIVPDALEQAYRQWVTPYVGRLSQQANQCRWQDNTRCVCEA